MMGLGFLAVLVVLGALRELIGQGTLFADMHFLLGPVAADWTLRPFADYPNMLFMMLPPGAFMGLGLLIALKNVIDSRIEEKRKAAHVETINAGNKRVRVTGTIS
jgi:electron transport complex protein RnfE